MVTGCCLAADEDGSWYKLAPRVVLDAIVHSDDVEYIEQLERW